MSLNGRTQVAPLDLVAYGSGNFAVGAAMQTLGTYLVFYATAVLGLPGGAVGLMVGLSILWDAVTDPLMGYLSDRTGHGGLGRRHPYLIAGALAIALTNFLVWNVDRSAGAVGRLALLSAWVILFKSAMTVYVTPYSALGAELSTDYNERTAIQAVKSVFFILGLAFVSVAGLYWFFRPTAAYPTGQLNPAAYEAMALATSIAVLASAALCALPTLKYVPRIRERELAFPHRAPEGLKASFARAFTNRPFRLVMLAYTFSNLSSALMSNLGLIVFTYAFGLGSGEIALVVGVQFLFAILSQKPWAALSARRGKRYALVAGFLMSVVGGLYFCALVLLRGRVSGSPLAFMPFAVLAGSGIGALFTLPLAMVADTVDLDEAAGGERIEGVYFGALTFAYKFSQAAALVLIGLALDLAGFDSSLAAQRNGTALALGLLLGLGASVSFGAAALTLRGYGLDEAAVKANRARIRALRGDVG
mgnify:FL=1